MQSYCGMLIQDFTGVSIRVKLSSSGWTHRNWLLKSRAEGPEGLPMMLLIAVILRRLWPVVPGGG